MSEPMLSEQYSRLCSSQKGKKNIFKSKPEVTISAVQKFVMQFQCHHLKRESKHRKGK